MYWAPLNSSYITFLLKVSSYITDNPGTYYKAHRAARVAQEYTPLTIEILHDPIYRNYRNYGSAVYVGSCRIPIINSTTSVFSDFLFGFLAPPGHDEAGSSSHKLLESLR